MIGEESDAPELNDEKPEWPDWSGYLRTAWQALRDDRFYGAMGGMGRIYYTAISRYAADHGIAIEPFYTFLDAMDSAYVTWAAEKAKQDADNSSDQD